MEPHADARTELADRVEVYARERIPYRERDTPSGKHRSGRVPDLPARAHSFACQGIGIPSIQRYELTAEGRRTVPFCSKLYIRAICPRLGHLDPPYSATTLGRAARAYDDAIHSHLVAGRLCA